MMTMNFNKRGVIRLVFLAAVIGGFFLLQGCNQGALTKEERRLLGALNFDMELLSQIRDSIDSEFRQLPAIDPATGEIIAGVYDGVFVETGEERAILTIVTLKDKFKEKGYLLFVFDSGAEAGSSVAVIKGTDELDILRYRRTNGINWELENEHVVFKIAEWDRDYGVLIFGCGQDWVELGLKTLPEDTYAFAEEVYDFCPDIVDQGTGELESLEEMIKQIQGVWLWWD